MDNRKSKRKNAVRQLRLNNVFTISSGVFALLFISQVTLASDCPPEEAVARVESLQGQLIVNNQPIAKGALVCADDLLATGLFSRAALRLFETQTLMRLDQQTQTRVQASQQPGKSWLEMLEGMIHLFSRDPRALEVDTPLANAAVEGTEFVVRATERQVQVTVVEGYVQVTNNCGALRLDNRQTAFVSPGRAPRLSTLITPEQAVQWTLYYPPVLQSLIDADQLPANLRTLLSDFNDAHQVLTQLARVPFAERNEAYFVYQAGWLLAVGQVPQAQRALDQALEINPASARAKALQAIIAVTKNDELMALALAKEAIQSDPDSAVGYLALSYAQQAAFQLDEALQSVQQAVANDPDNALAKARLAELLLAQGKLDEAVDVAEQAAAQAPDLAHTQTVLGFAYLSRIDTDRAKDAFERAIALDQAAPLPRLGLGLAQIRESDLEDGRENLETAVALDPLRSLYRSYLGKAYFEEKHDTLAGDQYTLAKQFDPMDPTPWLYDAILKQTQNRPLEALEDIQQSIKLNDNRAVYRSRLLLDEDLATRSAALGRVYNDLGFQQLGLLKGWKSVNSDPSNYSAHRLLADNYAALPRHEIARVSELLQSQLLQPINITPVQPSLGESNLLILEGSGPSTPSFNEFNPLFARNRLALQASGVFGSNDTLGDEVTHSGIWSNFSYSLGQFRYKTDGFRENNDLEQDIYNVFAQLSLSQNLSVQGELRHRDLEHGDLFYNFDLEDFDPNFRNNSREDSIRLGLYSKLSSYSEVIFSGIYKDEKIEQALDFGLGPFTTNFETHGVIAEAQHLFSNSFVNTVIGGGYYNLDINSTLFGKVNTDHYDGYLYSNIRFPSLINWTFGLSADVLNDGVLDDFKQVNWKFGLTWDVTPTTIIRIATFRTLKGNRINNQTIEPTQIAGFNQFFDDFDGTDSKRYGIAIDRKFSSNLFGGIEVSKRDLDIPRPASEGTKILLQDEKLYQVYINWMPVESLAIKLEFIFEDFNSEAESPNTRTNFTPLSLRYFHSSGLISTFGATYVNQEVNFRPTGFEESVDDEFVLLDLDINYRLPQRYGIISFQVNNLMDKEFDFQGLGVGRISNLEQNLQFVPGLAERTVFCQFTLAF
jgi:tetratricopeptide (TPR) repeat protein